MDQLKDLPISRFYILYLQVSYSNLAIVTEGIWEEPPRCILYADGIILGEENTREEIERKLDTWRLIDRD